MSLFRWSRVAANNGTADPTALFPEGMSPSAVDDNIRGAMAAVAKYRDDVAGAIVTAGTLNAYTVSSFEGFDSLANLNGQVIGFSPHVTNGDTVTLNVDGLGVKPLRSAPGVELVAGTLVQGTPYVAVYNNVDGAFYLRSFFSSPYNVPFLGGLDYWDTVTPNSTFIFPAGQAISRTIYSRAFARWGTKFGAGDGSTTFNVPDKTGRVSAMVEAAATRLTTAAGGVDGGTFGAVGGLQTETLTAAQIPSITSNNPAQAITVASQTGDIVRSPNGISSEPSGSNFSGIVLGSGALIAQITSTGNNNISVTSNNTGGAAHPNVQPTIVCNYILRIA